MSFWRLKEAGIATPAMPGESEAGGGRPWVARPVREGSPSWADLREDKMINPAPGFWPIFGPSGPTAGPGSPGNGPGSKNIAGCTKNQPRRLSLSPVRGDFVFLGPSAKR